MRTKLLLGAILSGLLMLGYAFSANQPVAVASAPKNLQVFPKHTSKKVLKRAMKHIAKALGVECDFCHDTDNFAKDTAKKKTARKMMRMVNRINKHYLKGMDQKVSCMTCHRGHKKPTD